MLRARTTTWTRQVRALAEGKPIHGEGRHVEAADGRPRCATSNDGARARRGHPAGAAKAGTAGPKKGPAQVASPRYRSNWDAIFGAAPEPAPEARTDENPAARKLLN